MFIVPALFDFADKVLLAIGITLVAASLPAMIRSLIPAIVGIFSYFMFQRNFTFWQIGALGITISGVSLGCIVQYVNDTEAG